MKASEADQRNMRLHEKSEKMKAQRDEIKAEVSDACAKAKVSQNTLVQESVKQAKLRN